MCPDFARQHRRQHRLRQCHSAEEVEIHDGAVGRQIRVRHQRSLTHAAAVNQDVDVIESPNDFRCGMRKRVMLRQIERKDEMPFAVAGLAHALQLGRDFATREPASPLRG